MKPKVCILLAAYNGAQYIEEQLESILNQTDVLLDIYISLDLSNDTSLQILLKYVSKHKNIHLLDYGKSFGSAGKNFFHLLVSVDFSEYDFVSFADQDDIWLPNKLCKSISEIQKTGSDAYSGNVTAFWADGEELLIKKDDAQVEFDYLFESSGPGCTFVLKRKLAQSIKESLGSEQVRISSLWLHDWFCYSFSRSNGFKWFIGSEPLMLYRQHDSNEVGASSGFKAIVTRAKIILSGDGLNKVITQADFLNQNDHPIKLIKNGSPSSLFKLACLATKCRRKKSDKLFFALALTLLSINKVFKS